MSQTFWVNLEIFEMLKSFKFVTVVQVTPKQI